jgi:flavin reductase (DIM6/NTAB) family NADH-FMN oxidoreductase RutF
MTAPPAAPGRPAVPRDPAGAAVFRAAMRQHGTGVAVITTRDGGPVGFCATSLSSASLDPPMISFAVAAGSASGRAWRGARHGIVHLLRSDQADVARAFARSGPDKFAGPVAWQWGPAGLPLLDNVLAWMLVSARRRVPAGDHLLVLCEVREAAWAPGPGPLIRHGGSFYGLPTAGPS